MSIFCTVKQGDAEGKKAFPQQVVRTQEGGWNIGLPSFDIWYN